MVFSRQFTFDVNTEGKGQVVVHPKRCTFFSLWPEAILRN